MTTEEARRYLLGKGWSSVAADAILHAADQSKQVIPTCRWSLCKDWASANERNHKYLSVALAFVTHEFQNVFEPIGKDLRGATTEEKAREIVDQYFSGRNEHTQQRIQDRRQPSRQLHFNFNSNHDCLSGGNQHGEVNCLNELPCRVWRKPHCNDKQHEARG